MNRKTKIILITILTLLLLATLGLYFLLNSRTTNSEPRRLFLPEGTTYQALCDSLDASRSFRLFAETLGLDERVRPGSYVVEPHMSNLALVRKLRNGQQDPLRLTIGKFRTPQQLNEYLNTKLMHNDFNIPLDSFHLVLQDTYEFYWTVTPEQFMQRMEKEYDKFWGVKGSEKGVKGSERTNAKDDTNVLSLPLTPSHSLSLREIIILASIVEEETNNNAEKPLIASVYLNRLRRGIPLQADPTVKYAVGDFTIKRILNKHLSVESPFNTYLHTGLPPAPICLPSKATIDAVINGEDSESNYLYFCASDKMDGTHRFAATLAEHQRNAAAFHRALDQRGVK
ncbi:MAG: endolytic transglycosylase MltG [Bacteroidales bacterium]|nr:endolytic transglycosylase MltG [Bacteroidales bacterium]